MLGLTASGFLVNSPKNDAKESLSNSQWVNLNLTKGVTSADVKSLLT